MLRVFDLDCLRRWCMLWSGGLGGFLKSVIKSQNPDLEHKLRGAIKKSEGFSAF